VENSPDRQNVNPLTISLQLIDKLFDCSDREFLERLVDRGLMDRLRTH
jgi:hypothetical protein